jgi:hypothetical protein
MNIILTLTPIYPHLRASVSGATDVDSSEFFSDFSAYSTRNFPKALGKLKSDFGFGMSQLRNYKNLFFPLHLES